MCAQAEIASAKSYYVLIRMSSDSILPKMQVHLNGFFLGSLDRFKVLENPAASRIGSSTGKSYFHDGAKMTNESYYFQGFIGSFATYRKALGEKPLLAIHHFFREHFDTEQSGIKVGPITAYYVDTATADRPGEASSFNTVIGEVPESCAMADGKNAYGFSKNCQCVGNMTYREDTGLCFMNPNELSSAQIRGTFRVISPDSEANEVQYQIVLSNGRVYQLAVKRGSQHSLYYDLFRDRDVKATGSFFGSSENDRLWMIPQLIDYSY